MPVIVCLSGKRGHGKSTVADHLVKKHGFQELSFAGPLKKACQAAFGLTDAQVHDAVEKETIDPFWKVTPRQLLQVCGTELFRDKLSELLPTTNNVWVKALVRQLMLLPNEARVCISDTRFPNEFATMHAIGALMVRIKRPNYVADPAFANHPSETALDDTALYTPDVLIWNNGTVEDVHNIVNSVVVPRLDLVVLNNNILQQLLN